MAVELREVRAAALALPGVSESDHHGRPSFRVAGKIIATLPDQGFMNIMVDANEARAAAGAHPTSCRLLWWGKRLSGLRVELSSARLGLVSELLDEAWRRRAPACLRRGRPGDDR